MQAAVERRPTLLLIVVLAGLFLLISSNSQTRTSSDQRTLLVRGVLWTFSPVPKLVNRAYTGATDIIYGWIDMRRAVHENSQLHQRIAALTAENVALRGMNTDLARIRSLLGYSEQTELPATLARVVMVDAAGSFKSLILDRGAKDGIEINDPVISADGLVGRVVLTTSNVSKVQLITDRESSVGAHFERTRRQGVVRGTGENDLQVSFVSSSADVVVGDKVYTAGIDGIYPRGILVGTVVSAGARKDLFKSVVCTPAADLSSLEDLIVLQTRKLDPATVRYAP